MLFKIDLFVKIMKALVEWNFLSMLCSLNLRHFLEKPISWRKSQVPYFPKVLDELGLSK